MESTTTDFKANASRALGDDTLQASLSRLKQGFQAKRLAAIERLGEFDELCAAARDIKDHTLDNLDFYLERFAGRVSQQGGHVHWCRDAAEARAVILGICRDAGAAKVTKSKSMIGEEIAINGHLEANGVRPVETDLGEYIIQLRGEAPSHIIAPAIHLSKEQVAETFVEKHGELAENRNLEEPRTLLDEARTVLRDDFLAADVGLSGANMMVAETGSIVLVTNEGNADLTMTLPRVHIALASIEKVVPTLDDAATILRVLARSATGQELSVYTTFVTGPRREGDLDGPESFHMVILDNGRSRMLADGFKEMLRCIRCGACLNNCPVYGAIGGHAYGWVYPGPMGSVLTPALIGLGQSAHLPNASTLCGKCESVCPMSIPLPGLLRRWREKAFARKHLSLLGRLGLKAWAYLALRPKLYRAFFAPAVALLRALGGIGPLARPEGGTFMSSWSKGEGKRR